VNNVSKASKLSIAYSMSLEGIVGRTITKSIVIVYIGWKEIGIGWKLSIGGLLSIRFIL
jgi:hypothetical protein